jgi:hypothetical protein
MTAAMSHIPRRQFLKLVGATTVAGASRKSFATGSRKFSIVVHEADPVASTKPVAWAVKQLNQALAEQGIAAQIVANEREAAGSSMVVVVAGDTKLNLAAESFRIAPGRSAGAEALTASAPDTRGLVYAVLELADRVQTGSDSSLGLRISAPIQESAANRVRSVARAFCSEVEDKPWYYDKQFWRDYLDMIAMNRFNRFNFAFGFGYDFPSGVTGDYFHYPYPYLVDVPGYSDVRVMQLTKPDGEPLPAPVPVSAEERQKNFEMLRFISAETGARGLQFQLGIWTHAYAWTNSPNAHHKIEGITPETHAKYSRDALAIILKECPEITGVTMRVHGESGIPEGSYPFWETLFEAIHNCGRTVEIDMHAKGINETMIDMAAKTGMPVKLGAKSWAEHMGLGYHQADIRELEIPRNDRMESGLFAVSNGARRFTRYGYADLFQQGQKYEMLFRLWPGTQRHLLWGDPAMARGYAQTAHFCNAAGLEICEPLTFKGREGSGIPGGRCAYLDEELQRGPQDWKKFAYTYRVWGRLLYNPEASPDVWQRYLKKQFGNGAIAADTSMANASRVLPLITTAHLPSASNHSFWPEMYANMPIVPGSEPSPYNDTPKPYLFSTVSPLDPQLFSSITEYVAALLDGSISAKYSPLDVAIWLETFTGASGSALTAMRRQASVPSKSEFRQWEEDVLIQNGLGQFFAAKLRSGMLYEIYLKTGNAQAGQLAVSKYAEARDTWATMAKRAATIYKPDVSYGRPPFRRGHWADRQPGIDIDLAAMRAGVAASQTAPDPAKQANAEQALKLIIGSTRRESPQCAHTPASKFTPGQALNIELAAAQHANSVELMYRHVNQGERWRSMPMQSSGGKFSAAIPGDYTNSPYPMQYYFVLKTDKTASLYPGFNAELSNQPYYAIWKRNA